MMLKVIIAWNLQGHFSKAAKILPIQTVSTKQVLNC